MTIPTAKALLVRLEAKADKDEEVNKFLLSAVPLVNQEKATVSWFALKFGSYEYAIFDTFPDEEGRDAHLSGEIAKALGAKADLFAKAPEISNIDIIAEKLPPGKFPKLITKAVLLTLKAKEGKEAELEKFLVDAKPIAVAEQETTYWFAIKLSNGEYGIFDVFPDNGARLKHLAGHVPVQLLKESTNLLGAIPDLTLIDVLAHKD